MGDRIVAALLVFVGFMLVYVVGTRWWALIPFPLGVLEWFNLLSPRPFVIRYWFNRNPKLLERYNLSFDDDGIHFVTKSINARIKWDQYTRVLENDSLLLLVYGQRMYTVVPKRAFKDDNEVARLRALVRQQIGSRESAR